MSASVSETQRLLRSIANNALTLVDLLEGKEGTPRDDAAVLKHIARIEGEITSAAARVRSGQ